MKSQKWDNSGKFSHQWDVILQSGSLHAKIPLSIETQWLEGFFSQIVAKNWFSSLHLVQRFDPFFVDPVSAFSHPCGGCIERGMLKMTFHFPPKSPSLVMELKCSKFSNDWNKCIKWLPLLHVFSDWFDVFRLGHWMHFWVKNTFDVLVDIRFCSTCCSCDYGWWLTSQAAQTAQN